MKLTRYYTEAIHRNQTSGGYQVIPNFSENKKYLIRADKVAEITGNNSAGFSEEIIASFQAPTRANRYQGKITLQPNLTKKPTQRSELISHLENTLASFITTVLFGECRIDPDTKEYIQDDQSAYNQKLLPEVFGLRASKIVEFSEFESFVKARNRKDLQNIYDLYSDESLNLVGENVNGKLPSIRDRYAQYKEDLYERNMQSSQYICALLLNAVDLTIEIVPKFGDEEDRKKYSVLISEDDARYMMRQFSQTLSDIPKLQEIFDQSRSVIVKNFISKTYNTFVANLPDRRSEISNPGSDPWNIGRSASYGSLDDWGSSRTGGSSYSNSYGRGNDDDYDYGRNDRGYEEEDGYDYGNSDGRNYNSNRNQNSYGSGWR